MKAVTSGFPNVPEASLLQGCERWIEAPVNESGAALLVKRTVGNFGGFLSEQNDAENLDTRDFYRQMQRFRLPSD